MLTNGREIPESCREEALSQIMQYLTHLHDSKKLELYPSPNQAILRELAVAAYEHIIDTHRRNAHQEEPWPIENPDHEESAQLVERVNENFFRTELRDHRTHLLNMLKIAGVEEQTRQTIVDLLAPLKKS